MDKEIHNLVLEGGGVGAIAYAGFLIKAQEEKILSLNNLQRVAGVSSGAIGALQIALNYTPQEMLTILETTEFIKFATMTCTFMSDKSTFTNEYLYNYLQKLIKEKVGRDDITFGELKNSSQNFKDLYVLAAKLYLENNVPKAEQFIFSAEHTPHAQIVDAVRASASLPILFSPMRLLKTSTDKYVVDSSGDIYIDGGLVQNFPIAIFDDPKYFSAENTAHTSGNHLHTNKHTFGIRLDSSQAAHVSATQSITNPYQYAQALLYLLNQPNNFENQASDYTDRTAAINTLGIISTTFDLNQSQKQLLLQAGKNAAEIWVTKFRQM